MCKNDLDIIITCYSQMYFVVNPEWRVLLSSLRPFSAPASVQRTHKIRARSPSQTQPEPIPTLSAFAPRTPTTTPLFKGFYSPSDGDRERHSCSIFTVGRSPSRPLNALSVPSLLPVRCKSLLASQLVFSPLLLVS